MKKIYALSLAFILFIAFGCSDKKETPTGGDNNPPVKYIIPMAIGNQWTGIDTMFNSNGTYNSNVLHQYRFEKDTTALSSTWYVMEISRIPSVGRAPDLYQSGSDGSAWLLYDYASSPASGTLWLKYPATAGEQYMTGPTGEDSVTVTNIDTSIVVPDSTYTCYRYKIVWHDSGDRHEDYYYMAPDAGFVKWEKYYTPSGDPQFLQYRWMLNDLLLY